MKKRISSHKYTYVLVAEICEQFESIESEFSVVREQSESRSQGLVGPQSRLHLQQASSSSSRTQDHAQLRRDQNAGLHVRDNNENENSEKLSVAALQ